MSISVAFRADASIEIGSGHVMRCLTLADTLAAAGARCTFVCRDLPGHRADLIAARGHAVDLLPGPAEARPDTIPGAPAHASWLPVGQTEDAFEFVALLSDTPVDVVVVDHYALDARWERAVRPAARRLVALDDLSDRAHACDLLLDQNLGRDASDYDGLVPPATGRLIGPRFALVRPNFTTARNASLTRRRRPKLQRILLSLGGVDRDNVTGLVLDTITGMDPPPVQSVDVVLGATAPWLDDVCSRCAALPFASELHIDTPRMAELMAAADLAIGAGGGTSWERCCLGLPTLIIILAENQAPAARALHAAGASLTLDHAEPAALCSALRRLGRPDVLAAMSRRAAAVCDGRGTHRVVRAVLATLPDVRRAATGDAAAVWEWRHAAGAARFYRSGTESPYPEHERWFEAALADPDRLMLIAELRGAPVAHLRFDPVADGTAAVSISMAPAARGQGLSRTCLEAGIARAGAHGFGRIAAEVHADNAASVRLFEGSGFRFRQRDGKFITYERAVDE